MSSLTHQKCPNCGHEIAVDAGFPVWCERCDWGLETNYEPSLRSFFERFLYSFGQRNGKQLFEQLKANPTSRLTIDLNSILALALATLVHVLPVILAVWGLLVLMEYRISGFEFLGSLLLFALAWFTRPALAENPSKTAFLQPNQFPATFKIVNAVAKQLHAPEIKRIVLNGQFNAAVSRGRWGEIILFFWFASTQAAHLS